MSCHTTPKVFQVCHPCSQLGSWDIWIVSVARWSWNERSSKNMHYHVWDKLLINIIGTWVFLKEEVPCFYLRSLCSSSFTEQKRWRKGTCNIWSFAETSELWQSQSKQPDVDEWLGQVMPRNSTAWMGTLPGVSLKMVMTELYADCGFLQEGLDSILEYHPNIIVILTLLGQEFMKYTIH